jgi:hypothetical protein
MHQSWQSMLFRMRGAIGILALTTFALLVPEQLKDMLVELADASIWPVAAFHLALFVLCFNLWHWSRALLAAWFELPTDETPRAHKTVRAAGRGITAETAALAYVPRLLFLAGAADGVIATLRSGLVAQAVAVVVWAAIAFVVLIYRADIQEALFGRRSFATGGPPRAPAIFPNAVRRPARNLDDLLRHAPFGRVFALLLLIVALVLMLAGAFLSFDPDVTDWSAWPQLIGRLFPGPSGALLCLGLTIGPLSALSYVMDASAVVLFPKVLGGLPARQIPVLFLLAVLILLTPSLVDLHAVRIAETSPVDPTKRAVLATFFSDWSKTCARGPGPVRPVIVALSGGASRAGIWSASVLTAVDEIAQRHGTAIFAISSVSGGSLGAAGYMATRAGDRTLCHLAPLSDAQPRDTAIMEAMRSDALGPMLAGTLFGDAPRALFGLPMDGIRRLYRLITGTNLPFRGGDRAEALERAFENNWSDQAENIAAATKQKPFTFDRAFLELAYDAGKPDSAGHAALRSGMPVWIANGTDGVNGDRILTAPFVVNVNAVVPSGNTFAWTGGMNQAPFVWGAPEGPLFSARDAIGLVHADFPISTAIDNSARFPFLSPEGELVPERSPGKTATRNRAEIIDGGYFENGGILTALELARWLRENGPSLVGREVDPIVIEATADGSLLPPVATNGQVPIEYDVVRCGPGYTDNALYVGAATRPLQVLAPFVGLDSSRGGRQRVVLGETRKDFCGVSQAKQAFFHLYLYAEHAADDIPLNWAISQDVATYIWNGAICAAPNRNELSNLESALGGNASATSEQWRRRCH